MVTPSFDAEGVDELAVQDVPETHGLVPTARGNVATVAGEVEGVNILLVAGEDVFDRAVGDIPYLSSIATIRQ